MKLANVINYIYVFLTIGFTVYAQLILKWRINQLDPIPTDFLKQIIYFLGLFLDPSILSCFFAGFLASLTWMATLSKFELSYAYPFMSLSFVLVLLFSGIFFKESISMDRIIGVALIFAGTLIVGRS